MKKLVKILLLAGTTLCCALGFAACEIGKDKEEEKPSTSTQPQRYEVFYTFDGVPYTIEVEVGKFWRIEEEKLPKKEGYVFDGLFDAAKGGTQYATSDGLCVELYGFEQDIMLFPQFTPIEYTLSLNYEGFTEQNKTVSVNVETEDLALPGDLLMTYQQWKLFDGWYTERDCAGTKVTDEKGKLLVSLTDIIGTGSAKKIQLYAGIKIQTYTLKFVSEANVTLKTLEVEHGTPFAEIAPQIEHNGKTVVAWKVFYGNTAFDKEIIQDDTLYPLTYNVKISFNSDGGASVSDQIVDEGESVLLPTLSRDHFAFLGWYLGDTRLEGEYTPTKNVTLLAKWRDLRMKVTLNSNDGNSSKIQTVDEGSSISLPVLSRQHYEFLGWYVGDERYEGQYTVTQDVTFSAKWRDLRVTVKFDSNGGSAVATQTVDEETAIVLPTPTRSYYTFLGWYVGGDLFEGTYTVRENITFTAKWQLTGKRISFDSNGGSYVSSYLVENGATSNLPTPTRDGYDFVSWTYQSGGSTVQFVSGQTRVYSDITLTANWKFKTVYYDSGDREIKITDSYGKSDGKFKIGDTINLSSLSVFLNAGYKLTFSITMKMWESYQGYQEFWLCNASQSALAGEENYELGGGGGADKQWRIESKTYTLSGSQCTSTMYMGYGAHGDNEDTWYLRNVQITVTVSKA